MPCGQKKVFGIRKDVVILGTGLVLVSAWKPPRTNMDIALYIVGGLAGYKLIHSNCWDNMTLTLTQPMAGAIGKVGGCGCAK